MKRRVKGAPEFVIGIDPGANTGYAFMIAGKLKACEAEIPIRIEERVLLIRAAVLDKLTVIVEDTRKFFLPRHLRQNHGQMDKGVGQVHAEMRRWEQFCAHHKIECIMQKPYRGIKKKAGAEDFKVDFPEYEGRTNGHGRDAAYLAASIGR